jgi:phosphoglycolate phosphatase
MRDVLCLDLDGTLIDSATDLAGALNMLLREEGLRTLDIDAVKQMIGDGAAKLVERGLTAVGSPPVSDSAPMVRRFLAHYAGAETAHTVPYPGVPETLRSLRDAGWRLGIVTNKPEAPTRAILDALNLTPLFDAIGGGDSFAVRKPHPGHPLGVLKLMGATPDKAIMVGDNAHDVAAAHAAGMLAVAVSYGYPRMDPEQLGADRLIHTFSDLPHALHELR